MAIDRGAPIHGTGWTIGDIVDAAGGGAGSPQAGQPTRFLTLTYHHPGNEDGNSVSGTTGVAFAEDSTIEEGAAYNGQVQLKVKKSSDNTFLLLGVLPGETSTYPNGVPNSAFILYRNPGSAAAVTSLGHTFATVPAGMPNVMVFSDEANNDSTFYGTVKLVGNELVAQIYGMSTNTPTDWTINVQLTPIAP